MRDYRVDEEPNFWPAVSDVFIGFLALMLLAVIAPHLVEQILREKEKGELTPPVAKDEFREEFERAFGDFSEANETNPHVDSVGFSELRIYFPASFLFDSCEIELKTLAQSELTKLRNILKTYDSTIRRIQVVGHTDDIPVRNGCGKGIRNNWELSALRAITVLVLLAPESGSGVDPRKVMLAGHGEYRPIDLSDSEEARARNRRIELLIRFEEI